MRIIQQLFLLYLLTCLCMSLSTQSLKTLAANSTCKFNKYLDYKPSSGAECESAVSEFLDQVEKCSFSSDVATANLSWQIQRNYTEEASSQLDEVDSKIHDSRIEKFKAAHNLRTVCAGSGSQLYNETLRLLRRVASGFIITDPKESSASGELENTIKGIYNFGKVCNKTDAKPNMTCYRIEPDLSTRIIHERNITNSKWLYEQYRKELIPKIKPFWTQYRAIQNKWAQKWGMEIAVDNWVRKYEMSLDDYQKEWDHILSKIGPLYKKMHSYLRHKLGQFYGFENVDPKGPIPAHLTGNLWSQKFDVADIVEPYPSLPTVETTPALKRTFGDNVTALLEHCINFYKDLGFDELPKSFWERSEYVEPKPPAKADCHASAHSLPNDDLRLSMCGKVDSDTYKTFIHEMGHIYYYHYYKNQRYLNKEGANPGFHEAIGDTFQFLGVGMPELIKHGWIAKEVAENEETLHKLEISKLIQTACDELMFIPNGILYDQWMVDYDRKKIPRNKLNAHWWSLTLKLQGITTPDGKPRGEEYFDVAAKYHVANFYENYSRYTLAKVYKFQFLKSMCEDQFQRGIPLHNCNISGNKTATAKFREMLSMGSSKPWPEAMQKATGQPTLSVQPLLDYFAPLEKFLDKYISNNSLHLGW